ncbi:DUF1800 family protein [Sphingomonas sp.]|uniref:DUF1800 domain-containing protein n=1 Tax=Sphingomonas sp. TaxID=28214 RepID=UPI001EB9848D|nr:DUF1800 family protein [Sphingomonas sp.]MBX3593053.1 DUF1800 domain-containing protein [Sphingomonas sp.]
MELGQAPRVEAERAEHAEDAPVPASGAPAARAAKGGAGALALAVSACSSGGGGSGSGGVVAVTPTPTPTAASITTAQASRFLAQATMGATSADIADVQARGYAAWIDAEFAKTRSTSLWDWLVSKGYSDSGFINGTAGFDNAMWSQLIGAGDQLRQRVGMALLELMVVGIDGVNLNWRQFAMAAYVDVLMDNAFGNFRTLMDRVTTNAAMASFLTFLGNRKANASTGSVPDENYARELMQLFTIGLYQLNMDGSQALSGGKPVETYAPADVSGLARIFTGLSLDSTDGTTPDRYRRPLAMNANLHETGASTFLGTTVAAGTAGMDAIKAALDTIFAHRNVAPFVSKQLIQRLVTSNPSAAYVGRVAAAFANNGSGVRGDMQAVIRAILLDSEARAEPAGTSGGKLREPVMRLTGWARGVGALSTSGNWTTGDTSSATNRLAQSMGRSGSVFNFFRPGYTPPNTPIANAGLVAPELQITNEISTVGYVNYMQSVVGNATDLRTDYAELVALAGDSQALIDRVNLVIAANQVSAATIASIKAAVDSSTVTGNRIAIAILLVMASPEYLTLK